MSNGHPNQHPNQHPLNYPAHRVSLTPGKGWNQRNFILEVLIPSLLAPRHPPEIPQPLPPVPTGKFAITWLGHASFLIRTAEHCLLIDPIWAKWLKIIKRLKLPPLSPSEIPAVDLVLITHAHFDHLDKKSLKAIAAHQPIAVPKFVGKLVSRLGFERIHELDTWQSFKHGHLNITLTPARHWGARLLHDLHRGFGGFLISYLGRTLFHCGDSAYFNGFHQIGSTHNVEIAILPIGAYDSPSQRDVHMNPEEALRAFTELRASTMIPMHYGSFRLSYEPPSEPPARLLKHAAHLGLSDKILILKEGQTVIL